MLHDMLVLLSDVISAGVLFFVFVCLLYLFLLIHPLFLNVCELKTHTGRKREIQKRYWPFTNHQHYYTTQIFSYVENIHSTFQTENNPPRFLKGRFEKGFMSAFLKEIKQPFRDKSKTLVQLNKIYNYFSLSVHLWIF